MDPKPVPRRPAGHPVHWVAPLMSAKKPTGHVVQAVLLALAALKEPASHGSTDVCSGQYDPAGQLKHWVAPVMPEK